MFAQFSEKRSKIKELAIAVAVVLTGCGLISERASAQQPTPAKVAAAVEQERASVNWGGLGWGLGIATNFDVGGKRVNSATVVNNVVRVDDNSSNVSISFVLEAHYFLRDYLFGLDGPGSCTVSGRSVYNCTELAHGPFVAIEVGGGNSSAPAANGPISGYAMGWMVGMRHPSFTAVSKTSSWNVGLGLRVSPNGKVFGDGIIANQPLPAGDSIRFKTEPRYGLMLMSTFGF